MLSRMCLLVFSPSDDLPATRVANVVRITGAPPLTYIKISLKLNSLMNKVVLMKTASARLMGQEQFRYGQ